ncbi:MAG TPA: ketoacyl-ACP synthase III [Pirellulales bacterium]|nr:ketoacyl-ACP synthase III [Pirellulales bacterium]
MSRSYVDAVRLAGVASAVPDRVATADEDATVFGGVEMAKIAKSTGIRSRRIAPDGICTSDLCLAAAERLLGDLAWDRDSIDTLIFVSQTPDYFLPSTSCSLHGRLGLSNQCAAFDVNLGCSGYAYGVWLASHLVASGASRRALLLAGDTGARNVNPLDRSARPLFGDAGAATAFERQPSAERMFFRLGTDGSGQNHLIVPAGGYRMRPSRQTAQSHPDADGNVRSLDQLYMNGAEIFLFTLAEVPGLVRGTLEDAAWAMDDVDAFVFHQANRFMLTHLAKSMKVPLEKLTLALEEFGNTSSASIPLAITARLAERFASGPAKVLLAGYGVGFSWAAAAITFDRPVVSEIVVVDTARLLERLASSESHLPECLRTPANEPVG